MSNVLFILLTFGYQNLILIFIYNKVVIKEPLFFYNNLTIKIIPFFFYVFSYHLFYADSFFVSNLFDNLHCQLPFLQNNKLHMAFVVFCCKMDNWGRCKSYQAIHCMLYNTMNHTHQAEKWSAAHIWDI